MGPTRSGGVGGRLKGERHGSGRTRRSRATSRRHAPRPMARALRALRRRPSGARVAHHHSNRDTRIRTTVKDRSVLDKPPRHLQEQEPDPPNVSGSFGSFGSRPYARSRARARDEESREGRGGDSTGPLGDVRDGGGGVLAAVRMGTSMSPPSATLRSRKDTSSASAACNRRAPW